MSKVRELIDEGINSFGRSEAEDIAAYVMREAKKSDFEPLILQAVKHRLREYVHSAERQARVDLLRRIRNTTREKPIAMPKPDVDHFRALLKERFSLYNNEEIFWGEATIEEHQHRISRLRSQIKGMRETIRIHEQAISLIEAAEVKCLNDVLITETETEE